MQIEADGGGDFRPGWRWWLLYLLRNRRRPS
jgi:hypothetical protein